MTTLPVVPAPSISMPFAWFPEMTLLTVALIAPTVLFQAPASMSTPAAPFAIAAVPAAFRPTRLPATRLPVDPGPLRVTPSSALPEITLPCAGVAPPMTLPAELSTKTPLCPLPRSNIPVASVPMRLFAIVLPPPPAIATPCPAKSWIAKPRTVVPPPVIVRPFAPAPAAPPSRSISGGPL